MNSPASSTASSIRRLFSQSVIASQASGVSSSSTAMLTSRSRTGRVWRDMTSSSKYASNSRRSPPARPGPPPVERHSSGRIELAMTIPAAQPRVSSTSFWISAESIGPWPFWVRNSAASSTENRRSAGLISVR